MSRIGKSPIAVPSGVDVTVSAGTITVKGPKGTLTRTLPTAITINQNDGELTFTRPDDERENRALHGLVRSLVNNMVVGVTDGFRKELEIVGVGYRAEAQGPNAIRLALGFSHPGQRQGARRHHVRGARPHAGGRVGHRQRGRRPGGRRHPQHPQARAVQGQGRPLPGRTSPAQGGQGRQEMIMSGFGSQPSCIPSPTEFAASASLWRLTQTQFYRRNETR